MKSGETTSITFYSEPLFCEQRKMNTETVRACFQTALNGSRERGGDGVVLYDMAESTIGYVLLNEVEPKELREDLVDKLMDDGNDHFYILIKDGENVDVTKVTKHDVSSLA